MVSRPRSWWQKIKQHPFITAGIVVALLVIIAFTLAVHAFGWDWTGFTGGESKMTKTPQGTTTEYSPGKNLWDWLGLLAALAIPVVVGIGAAWFTTQQAKVSDRENKDNQCEAALQAYIDKISELILKDESGYYGHISWNTWLRLRDYKPGALIEEYQTSGRYLAHVGYTEQIHWLRLTSFGEQFYRDNWQRYREMYPEVDVPAPDDHKESE